MRKGDKVSPCIILAGPALLIIMFITLEPSYAIGSNVEYFFFFLSFFSFVSFVSFFPHFFSFYFFFWIFL